MIQWMTMKDWAGDNECDLSGAELDARQREYWARLNAIRARLPADLLSADERLHDAELLSIVSDAAPAEVRLDVITMSAGRERWIFKGVTFHSVLNHRIALGGPPGFGHLGYSEITEMHEGFAIAILCSSGIEIEVHAKDFCVERVVPDSDPG